MDLENAGGDAGATIVDSQPVSETVSTPEPSQAGTGSARDSIDRAFAQIEAADKPVETAQTEAPKDTRQRNPDGTFAPKVADAAPVAEQATTDPAKPVEATTGDDAPSRFSPDAKAAWKDAPPAIKGEVKRALTELEGGLSKYREQLAPFNGLEPFAQMAAQSGKPLAAVVQAYVNTEQMLRQNPVQALEYIMSNVGMTPRQYAEMVMGTPPDQVAAQADRTILTLQQKINQLEQQFGTVHQTLEQQQDAQAYREIETFKQNRPRFDELRGQMGQLIKAGMAQDLDDAYSKADRLNPAPASVAHQPPVAAAPIAAQSPNPAAQTRKAALSVTGSPVNGSNPAMRKPASSARDAIDRSFATLGIG